MALVVSQTSVTADSGATAVVAGAGVSLAAAAISKNSLGSNEARKLKPDWFISALAIKILFICFICYFVYYYLPALSQILVYVKVLLLLHVAKMGEANRRILPHKYAQLCFLRAFQLVTFSINYYYYYFCY